MVGDDGRRAAGPALLPPGFRFRPTDEELLTHYLAPKAADAGFAPAAVREVDLYKAEPWDLLPAVVGAGAGGEDGGRYFFCRRSVKFPSGLRTNRATRAGYWKSTGKDRVVVGRGDDDCPVGVKKTLVFYRGRAPRGNKTGWVMHEYRLLHGHGYTSPVLTTGAHQSEWVICRMFMKKTPGETTSQPEQETAVLLHPPPGDHMQEPSPNGGGKTPAPAASDSEHANCFSNSNIALAMAPGDHVGIDQSVLQLLNHGREEWPVSYSWSSASASASPQAALLRDELVAADSFDILPQLLDYEAFPFLHDYTEF